MIYTIYLNPTIDKTVYFDKFLLGKTNRPKKTVTDGAGKAVNVSVVLKELGEENTCIGFVFDKDGDIIIERLDNCGVKHIFDVIKGSSRINTKIFDFESREITEINENGKTLTKEEYDAVFEKIAGIPQKGDVAVLTGSIPKEAGQDLYKKLIEIYKEKGVFCVLDASGDALKSGVGACPDLIKPNDEELGALMSLSIDTSEQIADALLEYSKISKIKYIALSQGSRGAYITDGTNVYFAEGLKVEVLSTVGAGDSMIAGMLHGISGGAASALECGVAAATASITREGTQLMERDTYNELLKKVKVVKIK